jgi:hypothetical protein
MTIESAITRRRPSFGSSCFCFGILMLGVFCI